MSNGVVSFLFSNLYLSFALFFLVVTLLNSMIYCAVWWPERNALFKTPKRLFISSLWTAPSSATLSIVLYILLVKVNGVYIQFHNNLSLRLEGSELISVRFDEPSSRELNTVKTYKDGMAVTSIIRTSSEVEVEIAQVKCPKQTLDQCVEKTKNNFSKVASK